MHVTGAARVTRFTEKRAASQTGKTTRIDPSERAARPPRSANSVQARPMNHAHVTRFHLKVVREHRLDLLEHARAMQEIVQFDDAAVVARFRLRRRATRTACST